MNASNRAPVEDGAGAGEAPAVVGAGLGAAPLAAVDRTGAPQVPGPHGASLWLGVAVALSASLLFALNLNLVSLAYASGANLHAVNLVRQGSMTVFLLVVTRVAGQPILLPRAGALACAGLGVLLGAQLYTLLGCVALIPVSVAVLLLYLYPFVVAGIVAALGRETLTPARIVAMVVALLGLALVLGVAAGRLDPRGVALAVLTAVMFGMFVVMAETTMAKWGRFTAMLHFTTASAVLTVLVTIAIGADLVWPATATGWAAVAGTSLTTAFSALCMFTAISLIGPLRTAIIDCGSPVWATLIAIALLGERMTLMQILGAALVVGAIVAAQLAQGRGR